MSLKPDTKIFQKANEVIKNNAFIRCKNDLTTVQRKSFALLLHDTIVTIKEHGEKRYYTMLLSEYKKRMGYSASYPTIYIAKELEELETKVLVWNIDKQGYGSRSTMLASFELEKSTGLMRWEFSNLLIDKVLAEGFTALKLSIILDFRSSYALALYENLQSRKNIKSAYYNLVEFRALMGIKEHEYQRMSNFKTFVLKPAIDEINAKSDMKVYYYDEKEWAKIIGFNFFWENLTQAEVKERNQRREKEENHRDGIKHRYGEKFDIGGKKHRLTKDGLVYRGKVVMDIIESYEFIKKLKKEGMLS